MLHFKKKTICFNVLKLRRAQGAFSRVTSIRWHFEASLAVNWIYKQCYAHILQQIKSYLLFHKARFQHIIVKMKLNMNGNDGNC